MIRVVQLRHPQQGRAVALVEEPELRLISKFSTVFDLANEALSSGRSLEGLISSLLSEQSLSYDPIYEGESDWKLLPCFDHPSDYHHCMLSGTGLTHKASADNRQKMHDASEEGTLTDSMKMYLIGVEGGNPGPGEIGAQPEWFYKGNGSVLRGHNDPLEIPPYADDGGEEPEIAGLYLCDSQGNPHRVGFATSNEFSDHVMERKNYLYLAPSKIRTCSIGPELVIGGDFSDLNGNVKVYRKDRSIWAQEIKSGQQNIVHSLENLEYHQFKYTNHRLPGMVHIHFMGADAFSFGDNIKLQHGDFMEVQWEGMGRPLRNSVLQSKEEESLNSIDQL